MRQIHCLLNILFYENDFIRPISGLSAAAPALGIQTTLPLGNVAVANSVVAGNYLNIHKKVPLLPTPGIVLPTTTTPLQPPQIVNPVLGSQGTITVPIANAVQALHVTPLSATLPQQTALSAQAQPKVFAEQKTFSGAPQTQLNQQAQLLSQQLQLQQQQQVNEENHQNLQFPQ